MHFHISAEAGAKFAKDAFLLRVSYQLVIFDIGLFCCRFYGIVDGT